jgi:D-amino peptidase
MKFFILTDLEGTACVYSWKQTGPEGNLEEYKQAKIWMTEEVNSCIEGILEIVKNPEIVVWDGHGPGGIELSVLHKEAKIATRGLRCPYTLDEGYDAMIMIAQHAKAGTPDANLCHTYSSRYVYRYWLNGKEIGEIGLRAYLAGYFNIPVILVSGDEAACNEAKELINNVVTVSVKRAIASEIVISSTPEKAREMIKDGIKKAIENMKKIKPLKISPPYVFRAEFLSSGTVYHYTGLNKEIKKINEYTIEIKGENFLDVVSIFA